MRYLVSFKLINTAANVALHLLDHQVPGQKQLNLIPKQTARFSVEFLFAKLRRGKPGPVSEV